MPGIGAETKIKLTNGNAYRIKDIVEQHISGDVYTLNLNTNQIETHSIIGWHKTEDRLPLKNWKHIIAAGYDSSGGFLGATFTNDTPLYVNNSKYLSINQIPASQTAIVQDSVSPFEVTTYINSVLNSNVSEFLFSLLAGQNAKIKIKNKRTAQLLLNTGKNEQYANWLINRFDKFMPLTDNKRNFTNGHYKTKSTSELALIYNSVQGNYSSYFMDKWFSLQGLALWIANSSIYNTDNYSEILDNDIDLALICNQQDMFKLISLFYKKLGIISESITVKKNNLLVFNEENTNKLLNLIKNYIPDILFDFIPEQYNQKKYSWQLSEGKVCKKTVATDILELRPAKPKLLRDAHVYNLDIEGSNNIFVGSVDNGMLIKLQGN